jgi:high-affinity iron transporter
VENLQQLGWLPVLNSPMWHTTSVLSENSAIGDVLHSFFGYSDAPTPGQLVIYVLYLGVVIITYLGLLARRNQRKSQPQRAQPAAQ